MPPIKTAGKGPQVSSSQIAMTLPQSENPLSLRFASTLTEIRAVQALRYQIFYGEFGATPVRPPFVKSVTLTNMMKLPTI